MTLMKTLPEKVSHEQVPLPSLEAGELATPSNLENKDAAKAQALSDALNSANFKSIEQKVGFILNYYPSSRDCDHDLQLKYWLHWDEWDGENIDPSDLKQKLTKSTSIIRARARIQNRFQMFQASEVIRKRRRMLCEEEREAALASPDRFEYINIFADETGKTEEYLIVGGIWISDPRELLSLERSLAQWRAERRFESELHFSSLKRQKEPLYREALDVVISAAPSMSFKALKLPKKGVSDTSAALDTLFYHYIVKGVEHEHLTHRCSLPRQIRFWKDSEQPGSDLLRIRSIQDKVSRYGQSVHNGKLAVGEFECKPSHHFGVLQIADLFIGSVGRMVNSSGNQPNQKDEFAQYMLQKIGMTNGPNEFSDDKDVSALFDM